MKEFYFISGLPRSGSTLLSAILRQNPEFYADISSPVQGLVGATINVITNSESNHLIDENRRKGILRSVFNAYYDVVEPTTVFDTSRGWTAKTSLLKQLYPQTKIICCVRDLPWPTRSQETLVPGQLMTTKCRTGSKLLFQSLKLFDSYRNLI